MAELRKQEEYKRIKKQKLDKERKLQQQKQDSVTSALKSPPSTAKSPKGRTLLTRQKSDSRSDSESPVKNTSKEKLMKMAQEHQSKILDDRKRLRRASEELGDPKIEQKPVVMLDQMFMSPDKNVIRSELVSPTNSNSGGKQTSNTNKGKTTGTNSQKLEVSRK